MLLVNDQSPPLALITLSPASLLSTKETCGRAQLLHNVRLACAAMVAHNNIHCGGRGQCNTLSLVLSASAVCLQGGREEE